MRNNHPAPSIAVTLDPSQLEVLAGMIADRLRQSNGADKAGGQGKKYLDRYETAARIGISVSTLDALCKQGKINPTRFGRRVLFPADLAIEPQTTRAKAV